MRYLFLLAAAAGLLPSTAAQTLNALIPGSSLLRFGTYDAETGTWLDLDTLDFAEAFISGTGSWDHWEGRYLVAGYGPGAATASLWSWDGAENQLVHAPSLGGDIGALHQDLSTALFYGLGFAVVDSTFVDLGSGFGYWDYDMELEVRSIDPATGSVATAVSLPFLSGYVSGATTFDSDAHRYHVLGYDALGQARLVTADVVAGSVVSSPVLDVDNGYSINEIEAGLDADRLWALRAPLSGSSGWQWVELGTATGTVTPLADLPGVYGFIHDASALDQTSGRYAFAYVDATWTTRIRVLDAATGALLADHAPGLDVAELSADNRIYAVAAYGTPSSVAAAPTPRVSAPFPNPTADRCTVVSTASGLLQVFSSTGGCVLSQPVSAGSSVLDLSALPAGAYVLRLPDCAVHRLLRGQE